MSAFVLEHLFPTGWRRDGQLFWRLQDAEREAERLLHAHDVRGIRVLAVRVNPNAIYERFAETQPSAARSK